MQCEHAEQRYVDDDRPRVDRSAFLTAEDGHVAPREVQQRIDEEDEAAKRDGSRKLSRHHARRLHGRYYSERNAV